MKEPRMPTTLPSPVDRAEFRFVAVDAAGAVWRWVDEEMVWVREQRASSSDVDDADSALTLQAACRRQARPR